MSFRWNSPNSFEFWDPGTTQSFNMIQSDKTLINNPSMSKVEDVMKAMCRVVAELIEIEESKAKIQEMSLRDSTPMKVIMKEKP